MFCSAKMMHAARGPFVTCGTKAARARKTQMQTFATYWACKCRLVGVIAVCTNLLCWWHQSLLALAVAAADQSRLQRRVQAGRGWGSGWDHCCLPQNPHLQMLVLMRGRHHLQMKVCSLQRSGLVFTLCIGKRHVLRTIYSCMQSCTHLSFVEGSCLSHKHGCLSSMYAQIRCQGDASEHLMRKHKEMFDDQNAADSACGVARSKQQLWS